MMNLSRVFGLRSLLELAAGPLTLDEIEARMWTGRCTERQTEIVKAFVLIVRDQERSVVEVLGRESVD